MKNRYIYLLKDPLTNEVRYIGQTANPESRLNGHINSNRLGTERVEWIDGLKEKGLEPTMEIVEECNEESADRREFYWILRYIQDGARLANASVIRGTRYSNKLTPEHRDGLAKLAERWNMPVTVALWLCLEYALDANPGEIIASVLCDFNNR